MSLPIIHAGGEDRILACLPPHGKHSLPKFRSRRPVRVEKGFSLLKWIAEIYDQNGQGSCVGHGAIQGLYTSSRSTGQNTPRLSPCFLYAQINGGQDQGAVVSDALEALKAGGTCTEATVGPKRIWKRDIPQHAYEEAKRFRIEEAFTLDNWNDILASLIRYKRPVVFGVEIGQDFEPDAEGYIPERSGQGGGHCMVATGVDVRKSRIHLEVVNSWGDRWGRAGVCYMPQSYFNGYVDAFAILAAREDTQDGDEPPTGVAT